MNEKKPRLFYWEDTLDGWACLPLEVTPAALETVGASIHSMEDGEQVTIQIKCCYMTDAEYDGLPEV